MLNTKRAVATAMGWATALCLPTLAHASGQLPILPVMEGFKSYKACVAALEAAYADDRKQVAPLKVEANGDRREVSLITKGVERIGPKTARYDGEIWYHNGRLRTDLPEQQVETNHNFEHRIRQCDGRTMKTTGDQGYTLSTFDPVDAPEHPKQ